MKGFIQYAAIGIIGVLALGGILISNQTSQIEDPVLGLSITLPFQGGTGTSTKPTYGQVLVGNANGKYDVVATSTLGFGVAHDAVTLAGQDYLTLSGQQITANTVDISDDTNLGTSGSLDYVTLSGDNINVGQVDIGDDTNLAGTANEITLTGDTLSLASPLTLPVGTTTATNLHVTGNAQVDGNLFAPVTLQVTNDLDVAGSITGQELSLTDDGAGSPLLSIRADDANPWGAIISNDTYWNSASNGLKLQQLNTGNFVFQLNTNAEYKDILFQIKDDSTTVVPVTIASDLVTLSTRTLVDTSVAGSAATPGLAFGDGNTGLYESSDNNLSITTGGARDFLFVNASGMFRADDATGPGLIDESVSSTNPTLLPSHADGSTGIGGTGTNTLSLITNSTSALYIDSSQNVGIGDTSPDLTLHANSGATQRTLKLETTASSGKQIVFRDSVTTGDANVMIGSTGDAMSFYVGSSGVESLTIDSSGNVGIGSTTPNGNLVVYSGASGGAAHPQADELIIEAASAGGLSILTPDSVTGNIYFASPSDTIGAKFTHNYDGNLTEIGDATVSGRLGLFAGNAEKMTILSTGNVGIGTTSPASKFAIADGNNNFRMGDLNGSSSAVLELDDSTPVQIEGFGSDLRFTTNGSNKVTIDSSGNMVVGDTAATYRMEVKGTAETSQTLLKLKDSANVQALTIQTDGSGNGYLELWDTDSNRDVMLYSAGTSYINGSAFGVGTTTVSSGAEMELWSDTTTDLKISGNSSGWTDASVLLEARNSTARGGGSYYHNVPGGYEWFWGRGYSTDDFMINRNSNATTHQVDTAQNNATDVTNFFTIEGDTGNVGIGDTSPESLLNLSGDVGLSWVFDGGTEDGIAVGAGLADGRLYTEGSQSAGLFLYDSGGVSNERTIGFQINGGTTKIRSYNDSGTQNTEFLTFNHNTDNSYFAGGGKVGIGTTSPLAKLTVAGTSALGVDAVSDAGINIESLYGSGQQLAPLTWSSTDLNGTKTKGAIVTTALSSGAYVSIYGASSYSSGATFEAARFGDLGDVTGTYLASKVGIATTTPAYDLDLYGDFRIDNGRVVLTPDEATDGATVTLDWSTNNKFYTTLAGNRTLAFSNIAVGQSVTYYVTQDGTGSRTLAMPSECAGPAITLSTTAGVTDILVFSTATSTATVHCRFSAGE